MIFIFWQKWLHLGQFAYSDYESEVVFILSGQDFSKSAISNFYINISNNNLFQETSPIVVIVVVLACYCDVIIIALCYH